MAKEYRLVILDKAIKLPGLPKAPTGGGSKKRGANIGEHRTWGGVEYEKKSEKEWIPVKKDKGSGKKEDEDQEATTKIEQPIPQEGTANDLESIDAVLARLDEKLGDPDTIAQMAKESSKEFDIDTFKTGLTQTKVEGSALQKQQAILHKNLGTPDEGMQVPTKTVFKRLPTEVQEAKDYKSGNNVVVKHVTGVLDSKYMGKLSKQVTINTAKVMYAPDAVYIPIRIKDDVDVMSIKSELNRWAGNIEYPTDIQDIPNSKRDKMMVVRLPESRAYSSVALYDHPQWKEAVSQRKAPISAAGMAGNELITLDMSDSAQKFITVQGKSGGGKTNGALQVIKDFTLTAKPGELEMVIVNPKGKDGKWGVFKDCPHLVAPIAEGLEEKDIDTALNNVEYFIKDSKRQYEKIADEYARTAGVDRESVGEFDELKHKVTVWNRQNPDKKIKLPAYRMMVFDEMQTFGENCNPKQKARMTRLVNDWRKLYRSYGARDMLITQDSEWMAQNGFDPALKESGVRMSFKSDPRQTKRLFGLYGTGSDTRSKELAARKMGEFVVKVGEDEVRTGMSPKIDLSGEDNEVSRAMKYMSANTGIRNQYGK